MKKLSLFLLVVAISITAFSKVTVAQQVPLYIEDAFKKAALPADARGKWVVQADVNIHKPDGTTIQGGGELRLDGNVLVGYLALKMYEGSYIKDQTMWLSILKSTPIVVAIRHEIAGKPYLGRPAELAKLKNLYTTPFSNGKVMWDSEECSVSIYLTPKQVKTGGTVAIRTPPKKPIGARYQITGHMEVTNAEDGVLDNTCYIYGSVWIKLVDKDGKDSTARRLFTLIPQDAMKGFKLQFDKNLFFDRYFEEPNWSFFHIEGAIWDQDGGMANTSEHDRLWETRKGLRFSDPKYPVGHVRDVVIPGDRDSENAEIYVKITKVKELFEKP